MAGILGTDPLKLLRDQRGIIVKICNGSSLFIWSKELGYVYAPFSCLERGRNHRLCVGQWMDFDVQEQEPNDSCHWVVINKCYLIDDQLKCRTTWGRRQDPTYLQTIDCIGIVTNVFGNEGLLWSNKLGRVYISEEITEGWCNQAFVAGNQVTFNAERSMDPDYEDIGWQATNITHFRGTPLPDCIQQCIAELVEMPQPFCGVLYNEEFGKISFTWMDVIDDKQFRASLNEHKCLDVRFVPSLKHASIKWSAVYVQPARSTLEGPINHQNKAPQQDEPPRASDDSFTVELENELQEWKCSEDLIQTGSEFEMGSLVLDGQLNNKLDGIDPNQAYVEPQLKLELLPCDQQDLNGNKSDFTTSVQGQHELQMQDASCQTEPLAELALFRLICSTPALFSVMTKNHKDQILVMRKLVKHKFIPNYQGAKVECESTSSHEQRVVSCQTAATPESELAERLINDQEMFNLLVEIDQNLLMSIP